MPPSSVRATWLTPQAAAADIIGVANLAQKLDYRLVARPEVKTKEDLRGKRIAISDPGSTSHLVTMLGLQSLNVDSTQARITLVNDSGNRNEPALGDGNQRGRCNGAERRRR
mgnify:CR=1 FL=1